MLLQLSHAAQTRPRRRDVAGQVLSNKMFHEAKLRNMCIQVYRNLLQYPRPVSLEISGKDWPRTFDVGYTSAILAVR